MSTTVKCRFSAMLKSEQKLKSVALSFCKISANYKISKYGHSPRRPLRGQSVVRGQDLPMTNVRNKFKDHHCSRDKRHIFLLSTNWPHDLDLLTLKSVWESCVTWGTSVTSFVFLGLSVFELGSMYATERRMDDTKRWATLKCPNCPKGGIMKLTKLIHASKSLAPCCDAVKPTALSSA